MAARESDRLALLAPVALGLGVWAYFAPSNEPPAALALSSLLLAAAALLARAATTRLWLRALCLGAALIMAGYAAAHLRSERVAAPVWPEAARAAQTLEARVLSVERRPDGRVRAVLDAISIAGRSAEATPERLRLATRADADGIEALEAGARIRLRARLRPPPPPVEPGGFDFRFRAWFDQIGGFAFPAGPIEPAPAVAERGVWAQARLALDHLRAEVSARARAAAPGVEGAVVAALLVGDRSGLDEETLEALRASNLAHLLAISGLHMGLVCLTMFGAVRLVFAFAPEGAAPFEPKKIAAVAALLAGAGYLAISGGAIPTQRAYIMALVAFGAVLVDRSAITLRAVAVAASLILLWRPESLFSVGFQLSFAATTAVVAAFQVAREPMRRLRGGADGRTLSGRVLAGVALFVAALALSSLMAGLATAPFAAFYFSRVARYGLLANLAAVPAMGLWIMPAGLAALLLAPFGLDLLAYQAMALGVGYVLGVAHWIANLPAATGAVGAGPDGALALIAFGGLQLAIWRGFGLRALGIAPILLGLALWRAAPRPEVLIAPGGALIGAATEAGRVFDRARGGDFAASSWLRRDGDPADRADAAARPGFTRWDGGSRVETRSGAVVFVDWRREPAAAPPCGERGVWILMRAAAPRETENCLVFDRDRLTRTGAVALFISERAGATWRVETARRAFGRRPWSAPADRRAAQ